MEAMSWGREGPAGSEFPCLSAFLAARPVLPWLLLACSRAGCADRALSGQPPLPLLLLAVLPTSCVTLGESLCLSGRQSPWLAQPENWVTSAVRIPSADTCWAVTGRVSWVTCDSHSFLKNFKKLFFNYSWYLILCNITFR